MPATISVLMCVYNTKEEFLKQSIESILKQTFPDFQFVIVDDGSDAPTHSVSYFSFSITF